MRHSSRALAVALIATLALILAGLARSPSVSLLTFAAVVALGLTLAAIVANTFRNSHPAPPMGRLIHDVDETPRKPQPRGSL